MNKYHRTIDLNCDLGEGGQYDEIIMPLITSANIASGGHAGDIQSIRNTVTLARCHATAIGSHPGHADPEHFGRRPLLITPLAAAELVTSQVEAIAGVACDDLHHVKLHGALYHQVGSDEALAAAVSRILKTDWPHLLLYAEADSQLSKIAQEEGITVAFEAFADRRYTESGTLVGRQHGNAFITDKDDAAAQVHDIVIKKSIRTTSNAYIPMDARTLCIHGDGLTPVSFLHAIRDMLTTDGIALKAPVIH